MAPSCWAICKPWRSALNPFRQQPVGAMCPPARGPRRLSGRETSRAGAMEKRAMFHGSMTALVTPFKDGEIDEHAYRALIDWQIRSGAAGLVRRARPRASGNARREPDAQP